MRKALMAVLTLSLAAAANAGGDRYGALAYNKDDGSYGWAVDAATQQDADDAALEQCGDDCEVVMHFQNTCAALALGNKGSYGWAYAPTKDAAQNKALGFCREHGSGCAIKVWACTTR